MYRYQISSGDYFYAYWNDGFSEVIFVSFNKITMLEHKVRQLKRKVSSSSWCMDETYIKIK
ncbi:hypothetical protein [Photobacterium piscicola]|uniref:hypothetical protein n=1 Tax=Photobacterium piscicola TaxID=1378299 RepID=UPI0037358560